MNKRETHARKFPPGFRLPGNTHWFAGLVLLFLALIAKSEVLPDAVTHQFDVAILGVSEPQAQQIRTHLDRMSSRSFADIEDRLNDIEKRTRQSLQAIGYYRPSLNTMHATDKHLTAIQLFVDVGKPVVIEDIVLDISGEAQDNREFQRLLTRLPIDKRQVLNHGNYESAKDQIYSLARQLGFFDARFTRSQVLVESDNYSATIFIGFDSGKRHRISRVNFNTDLFSSEFLKKWQPFEDGAPYRASYAAKLTNNLQNSGYFKNVSVKPDLEHADQLDVALDVDLVPASENVMSLGAGYATDTELRFKGSWLRPHHNVNGHVIQGVSSVSRLRQEVSLSYGMPHRQQPEHGKYSIEAGLLNHRSGDTFSQLRTVNFSDSRLTESGWYRDVFVRLENENTQDRESRTNLVLPGISFSRTRSSGGIHPDHGTFLSFKLLGGNEQLFSDINMLRFTASAKQLISWNQKHYWITRAEFGFLKTSNFDLLAPSHRFFTGGDNSVRGFEFQSISPANATAENNGGRYLSNFSVEYNRYFKNRWALAAFVDTGRAFNNSDEPYRVGVGAGIRWLSPVGPLRIDVAVGVSEEDNPVRMHLAIGPQL